MAFATIKKLKPFRPGPGLYKVGAKTMKKYQAWKNFYESLERLGISQEEADQLRRIEMTLHRWAERECNGEIERDEDTGKTYVVSSAYVSGRGDYKTWPCPDKESGALKRLEAIMKAHPELWCYHQGDPRGCALYIGRKSDIRDGERLESVYSLRGVAICLD